MTINRLALSCVSVAVLLAGCKGVEITSNTNVPLPLVEQFPATVGLYMDQDLKGFAHAEERWGSKWKANLGVDHQQLLTKLYSQAFRSVVELPERKAPEGSAINVILQPIIEQYSFITPRDTGNDYFAVTIKYRLEIYTPAGQLADTLSFTGYGSSRADGFSSGPSLQRATQAAMRDAAAKFLVQFPEQAVAQKLRGGEQLIVPPPPAPATVAGDQPAATPASGADPEKIEAVPIIDPGAST